MFDVEHKRVSLKDWTGDGRSAMDIRCVLQASMPKIQKKEEDIISARVTLEVRPSTDNLFPTACFRLKNAAEPPRVQVALLKKLVTASDFNFREYDTTTGYRLKNARSLDIV